jgi:hypothetical protein
LDTIPTRKRSLSSQEWQTTSRLLREEDLLLQNRVLSYVTAFGRQPSPPPSPRCDAKISEVIRNKSARQKLPGWTCPECHPFYETLVEQGLVKRADLPSFLRQVSRHKAPYQETSTPEEMWATEVNTPEEWKEQDRLKKRFAQNRHES